MPSTYTLISSNVLTTAASSLTFSSIPSTYTDLVLRISSRTSEAVIASHIRLIFNFSFPTQSTTSLSGDGSSASSSRRTSSDRLSINWGTDAASATSSTFSNTEVYIPNYKSSTYKPVAGFGVTENNSSISYLSVDANLWQSTAAINEVRIQNDAGQFIIGSSFYLYGIKNS